MRKLPDWYERLCVEFHKFDGSPWIWGESDCAYFVEASLRAMFGEHVDFMGTYRGAYHSRLTAAARMIGHRHYTMREFARDKLERLGAKPVHPLAAPVGSIGVADDSTLCVRFPAGFLARKERGRFQKTTAVAAWSFD